MSYNIRVDLEEMNRLKAISSAAQSFQKEPPVKKQGKPKLINLLPIIEIVEQVVILGGWDRVARLIRLGMQKEKEMEK